LVQLAAYAGEIAESMTRTFAWRFLDLGRRIERALRESLLLQGMLASGGGSEPEALEALLEITDSVMTYRSRYASRFQLGAVLDLMICDETNPRSIAHQIVESVTHVNQLRLGVIGVSGPADEEGVSALLSKLRNADIIQIASGFEAGARAPLVKLLKSIDDILPELSDIISHRYFFHSGPIQRLADFESQSSMQV
jgi:uncharacterized alpha-E superfamily protein